MKTLSLVLAATATLISGSAFAESMVGTVHTAMLVHCEVTVGCTNTVESATLDTTVGGISKTVTLTGNLSKLANMNGQMVTVHGTSECLNGGDTCTMSIKSAKIAAADPLAQPLTATTDPGFIGKLPAPAKTTLIGTVSSFCLNGGDTCRATLNVDGKTYGLSGDFSKIAKHDGQIVSVTGTLATCAIGMGGCGESIIVSSIHKVAAEPLTDASADGSNVGRNDSTTASAAGSSAAAASVGVGIKRN